MINRIMALVLLPLGIVLVLAGCVGGGDVDGGSDQAFKQAIPAAENPAEVIAVLGVQPAPQGVADDVWKLLTTELVRVLAERASGKLASAAPSGPGGATELSYVPASTSLQWLYVNPGDYDQNGVVSVSDLTPLGVHFGETSSGGAGQPFDPLSKQWVVDGDGNGVIDLGDITPIGANFGVTVEGYRVYYSEDEGDVPDMPDTANGPGAAGLVSVPFWSADQYQGRLRFTQKVDPTLTQIHYWVRPYHSIDEGAASNSVTVSSAAPEADLAADVTEGNAPLHVVLDASGSTDPDGFIARYDYDFDSNGAWDAYDAASSIVHEYADPGVYTALVRVTDNDFANDTATLEITVTVPDNEPPVADLSADVTDGEAPLHVYFDAQDSIDPDGEIVKYEWDFEGTGTYLATGNDPTIDYTYDHGYYTAELRVTDDRGDTDTATLEIKARGWVIVDLLESDNLLNSSLAIVDGNPAISCRGPDLELLYVRSSTSTGISAGDWQVVQVDPISSVRRPSLAVVHGNPAISYCDAAEETVKYARAITVTGESSDDWQVVTVADGNGPPGPQDEYYQQLAVVAGRAAICYYDVDDQCLKYVRATTMAGTGPGEWGVPVVVDDSGVTGWYCSLAVVDGNPAIGYWDYLAGSLKYARSLNSYGTETADWQVVTVAHPTEDYIGMGAFLADVNGNAAISFGDGDHDELRFARADSATGLDGAWTVTPVNDYNSQNTRLCVLDNSPAICFIHSGDLYYVKADNSTGTGNGVWPPRTAVDDSPGRNIRDASMAVVNGQVAISYSWSNGLRYAILY